MSIYLDSEILSAKHSYAGTDETDGKSSNCSSPEFGIPLTIWRAALRMLRLFSLLLLIGIKLEIILEQADYGNLQALIWDSISADQDQ